MVILLSCAPVFFATALLLLLQSLHNAKEAARHRVCSQYTSIYAKQAQFMSGEAFPHYNAAWQTVYAAGLLHCGDYAQAKTAFEQAFRLAATPAQAHLYYMETLMSLGQRTAAKQWLAVFKANKSYQYLPEDLIHDYQHLASNISAKRTARYKATIVHTIKPLPLYHRPWFILLLMLAGVACLVPPLLALF